MTGVPASHFFVEGGTKAIFPCAAFATGQYDFFVSANSTDMSRELLYGFKYNLYGHMQDPQYTNVLSDFLRSLNLTFSITFVNVEQLHASFCESAGIVA